MRRLFLLVVVVGLLIVVAAGLALGLFPPGPRTQPVQHTLPNDRFQPQR